MLVDSHAHLEVIDNLEGTLSNSKDEGVGTIIAIGTSLEASKKSIAIAGSSSLKLKGLNENIPKIYATVGIHPQDGKEEIQKSGLSSCINYLTQITRSSEKVVAIGECGLDYYLDRDKQKATSDKEKKFQRELFVKQVKLAAELNLPLVVHCRNAWSEIFDLLPMNDKRSTINGVFHSWTGDWAAAKKALDLGFYISFSGIVTFKNAKEIQDVAKMAPLDQILIETDSPFLAPEPFRGQPNEPKNVRIIADFLASKRNQSVDEISSHTGANAKKLFNIL